MSEHADEAAKARTSEARVEELRADLRRRCTPAAADESLLADVTAEAARVLWAVQAAQARLASSLVPEVLADARRAKQVLDALKAAVDIGGTLARRIETTLLTAVALKRAKAEGSSR